LMLPWLCLGTNLAALGPALVLIWPYLGANLTWPWY
jgi:hypothetical protein